MTRHGRNCTASAVYSYHEKQKDSKRSGWGSQKARFSKDSIKEFDCCSLTLQPCKDPVVTKEGHLYERQSILEYILHQKQQNAKKMKAYEKQIEKDKKKGEEAEQANEHNKVEKFLGLEKSISTKRDNPFSSIDDETGPSKKKKVPEEEESIVNTSEKEKNNLPSFWIPTLTPEASETRAEKPDMKVYCPMSEKPLKMKDLINVKFTLAPEENGKSLIARKDRYICPVTHDVLSNASACAVLRPTGDVITMSYVDKFIKKDWTCPLTGKKLKENDIIELKRGGTGYSAVGDNLEGKVYGPTMMCS